MKGIISRIERKPVTASKEDAIYLAFVFELAETIKVLRTLSPSEYWERTAELRREARRHPQYQFFLDYIDENTGHAYNPIGDTQPLRDC